MARSSSVGGFASSSPTQVAPSDCSGLAVSLAAGDYVDFAIPGLKDANGQRCRAPKAEETDAFSALNSRDAEAAEADDARA